MLNRTSVYCLFIALFFLKYSVAQEEKSPAHDTIYNIMVKAVSFDKSKLDSFLYLNDYAINLARGEMRQYLTIKEFNSLSASYFNNIAVYWQKKGIIEKALVYMDSSIRFGRVMENDTVVAIFYNNIGTMYLDQGDVINAEKNHNQSLKIRLRLGDSAYIGNSYNNIGNMFQRQNMSKKAEEYYKKSLKFYKTSDPILSATPMINIANIYKDRGDFKTYYKYTDQVYRVAEKQGNERYMAQSLIMAGRYFLNQNELDTAYFVLDKARQYFEFEDNPRRLATIYSGLAHYYQLKGIKSKTIQFAKLAQVALARIQTRQTQLEVFKLLSDVYSGINQDDQALIYLNAFHHLKDSLESEQFIRRQMYKENQLKFRFEKDSIQQVHNAEMAIADEKLKSEQQMLLFIILGIIAIVIIGVVLIWNYRLKQKFIKESYEKEQLLNQHLTDELKAKTKKLVNSSLKNIKTQKVFKEIEKLIEDVGQIESEDIESNVQRIKSEIRGSKLTEKKLDKYEDRLISENEGFTADLKLKYPELTPKELRLCVLLKMNYSSDEICDVLGIAATTLKSSRYRIHKKMKLEKGTRLQDHLITLT